MNPATPVRSAACLIPRNSQHIVQRVFQSAVGFIQCRAAVSLSASLSATGVFRAAMGYPAWQKDWFQKRYRLVPLPVAGNTVENFVTRVPYHHRTRASTCCLILSAPPSYLPSASQTVRILFYNRQKCSARYRQWVRQIQQLVTKPLNIRSQRGPSSSLKVPLLA